MMGEEKKKQYIPQPPHDAEHCHINEYPYNHPMYDCGHDVPATGPALEGKGNTPTGPAAEIKTE